MRHIWTYDECYELAKTCRCSSEFAEKHPRAHNAAIRHKWIKDYTWFVRGLRSIRWTYDACYKEAQKYTTRLEFQKKCSGAYAKALQRGWLDDYDWMTLQFKPKGYWNDYDRVKEEAKKYSSRTEFYKGNQFVYYIAIKNGWMEDFIPSKIDLKERIRCVYSYEFKEFNVVYVGLTDDKERRHLQHLGINSFGKSNSPVLIFAKDHKTSVPEPKYWYDNCTVAEAQKYEDEVVKHYEKNGWILLNRAKTGIGHGSIGGAARKWTKKECYDEARKYNSRTEFSANCQSAYAKALRKGWIDDYVWFSTLGNRKWTYEACYNEARKYKTRWDFGKGNHHAYQTASQNKWLDDYYWFEKPIPKVSPRKWTYEACRDAARNCSTRSEFVKRYKGAYEASRKNGWIDKFIPVKRLNQFSSYTNNPAQYSISFDN